MRLRPIIGWGVFFFIIAIVARSVPSPSATFFFFKGKYLMNTRRVEEAAKAYEQSVAADPSFARGYVELGVTYTALEKYDDAVKTFSKAIAIRDDSCASCGLGMSYRLLGKTEEAETALRRSIKLDPSDTCPYNQLGRMYYELENYPKAIEAFNQELKLHSNAVTYHFLANATYYNGEVEKSIDYYKEVLRVNPKYEDAYIDFGRAYNRLGRHKEAIIVYETALKVDRTNVPALVGLGMTHFMLGHKRKAEEQYERLRELDPEWAERLRKAMQNGKLAPTVSESTEKH